MNALAAAAFDLTAPVLTPAAAVHVSTTGLLVSPSEVVDRVRAILSLPDEKLDYAGAQLALERIIDPSINVAHTLAELDRMAETARNFAGPDAGADAKLAALRKLIYESGPWNGHRPAEYDHENCRDLSISRVTNYLWTRRGQCVSMPVLFLILADKLGLDMGLATAPDHFLVRYKNERGRILNLETTSGAYPAREAWIRREMPMSDRALANGIYLRTLPRREAISAMAGIVVTYLVEGQRHAEIAEISDIILQHSPRDVSALLWHGSACGYLIETEFRAKYPTPTLIPEALQPRYLMLAERNYYAFKRAEELGWEEAPSDD